MILTIQAIQFSESFSGTELKVYFDDKFDKLKVVGIL